MDEATWLIGNDPGVLIDYLTNHRASERKVRLFACAWWRLLDPHGDESEDIVRMVEECGTYDDRLTGETINTTWLLDDCRAVCRGEPRHLQTGATLLRCIFGNPFRRAFTGLCGDIEGYPGHHADGPNGCQWCEALRAPVVVGVARRAYEAQDWSALPVLADALQESGCTNETVLAHLYGPGPHCRGCWVLDLLLGLR